jgi:hypothetical protein
MSRAEMRDEERLRNPLCVRWSDEEHTTLVDTAWRMRIHASELVRRFVAEGLARLAQGDAAKAETVGR